MDRRDFLKKAALVGAACFIDFRLAFAQGTEDNEVGKAWEGLEKRAVSDSFDFHWCGRVDVPYFS